MFAVANSRNAGMRADDAALVEQRQAARDFQHALDDEHHVGAAGVIFVEAQRDIALQRPGQDAVAKFGDLLAVLQDDRVLADEIDAGDVAVEIDAHAGPVQPRRDLLDMRRFAGAVIAGDHHAAIAGKARQDRQRGLAVENVIRVEIRHVLVGLGIGRHFEIGIDPEDLPDRDLHVGQQIRPVAGRGFRELHSSSAPAQRARGEPWNRPWTETPRGRKRARSQTILTDFRYL